MLTTTPAKPRLLTFWSLGWVLLLAALLAGYAAWWTLAHRRPILGDGRNLDSYRFDLSTTLVPRSQIIPGGMPRDGLHAMTAPVFWSTAELDERNRKQHHKLILHNDLVIGIDLNRDARAYPLQTLALHEIVNDTVAEVPIAITHHPLSGTSAVFDRTVNGETLEFHVSGLLYQSNLLMYDHRPAVGSESLWSQLQTRAIAGPAAARSLTLSPRHFTLTTWEAWRAAHPATRILAQDPDLAAEYPRNRYATYLQSDDLRFPVDPDWSHPTLQRKTPIVAIFINRHWEPHLVPTPADPANLPFLPPATTTPASPMPPIIYSYLFAWHATHPTDPIP